MLNKIKVKNFKCFLDNDFPIKRLTYLTGGNASGKSSLLQTLILLKQIEKSNNSLAIIPQLNNINLGLPIQLLAANSSDNYILINLDIDNREYSFKLNLSDDLENQFNFVVEAKRVDEFNKEFNIFYINAERMSPKTVHRTGMKNNYVGINGEYAIEAISLFDSKSNIKGGFSFPFLSDKKLSFQQACNICLSRIFGDTELQITNIDGEAGKKLSIKNESGFYIPVATGFGISYCLPIIVQGLISIFENNKTLIVENPEAHLHPKSQSELGRFLAIIARAGVQIVVETHSEHIINGSRVELGNKADYGKMNTLFFTKSNGQFVQNEICLNEFGEMQDWPEGFFDQTEIDIKEILMRKIKANGAS